jgi:hypothetical protein
MQGILGRFAPQIYALLRIVSGLLFACHGLQKFGLFGGKAVPIMSELGLAAVIELVGGVRLHEPGGVHPQRRDGGRLFQGARARRSRAVAEWRRARRALLLHLPVYRGPR